MKYLKKYEFVGVSQDDEVEEDDLTPYERLEKSILEYDEVEDIEQRIEDYLDEQMGDSENELTGKSYDKNTFLSTIADSIVDNEWVMDVMDILVKYGVNINHNNRYGYTPLFDYAETEDEELFDHALKLGADIKHRDNGGGDVLHHYLNRYGKDLDFFKYMIEKGANVKNITNNGESLLFLSNRSEKIFDYLLENVDPNIINSDGKNALCGFKSQLKRFKKLLQVTNEVGILDGYIFQNSYGEVKNYYSTYSFQSFIGENHPYCFKYLIDNGIEIDKRISEEYDYVLSAGDMGLF